MTCYIDECELRLIDVDDMRPEATDARTRRMRRFESEMRMMPPDPRTFVWTSEAARRGRSYCSTASTEPEPDPRYLERRAAWLAHLREAMRGGPIALLPYDSPEAIVDERDTIEPIHTVYRLLRHIAGKDDSDESALAEAHATMHTRLTSFFDDKQRRALLRALERVQLFEQQSAEYLRGCRFSPIEAVETAYGTLSLPIVLYWLCKRDLADDAVAPHPSALFVLGNRCGLASCCTPEHRCHSFKPLAPVVDATPAPVRPNRKRCASEIRAPFIDRMVEAQVSSAVEQLRSSHNRELSLSPAKKPFFRSFGSPAPASSSSDAAAMLLVNGLLAAALTAVSP